MSDDGRIPVYLTLGFGFGIYCFAKGFRIFREYRVLADTPEMPIRSVAMGLVEIHGKATGEKTVTGPVTGTPCLFYKVNVEKWVTGKNGGHWSNAGTDADGPLFYLDDGTGKVLVNAHGAELDLLQTGRRETGSSFGRSITNILKGSSNSPTLGPAEDDLHAYAQSVASGAHFSLGGIDMGIRRGSSLGFSSRRYRLTEFLILPDHWYDVTGSCIENQNSKDEHDRNIILKGQNEPTFLISWRSEKEIEGTLRKRAIKYIFGGAVLSVACLGFLIAYFGLF
jgi:hypothetical protein